MKDTDELYEQFRNLFDGERWNIDALFKRVCRHTVEIAEGAEARYQTERNYMPRYDMTAEERERYGDRHIMFRQLLEEGFRRLVPQDRADEYRRRLKKEVYILESTDNIDYLLVQYDTVSWARRNGILVGCGRGSAGGSLVLYLLGITLIDPIQYNLLFERFLLPERAGLYPDLVTRLTDEVRSDHIVRIRFDNGTTLRLDRDAELVILRNGNRLTVYADQLRAGDDVLFDNRDILFHLQNERR